MQEIADHLGNTLLAPPNVRVGRKFGREAFFFRKRFFCHFHVGIDFVLLQTYVSLKVKDMMRAIPDAVPLPQYAGHGWVRL